jgi:glutaminyl-peptide cyclotransferase
MQRIIIAALLFTLIGAILVASLAYAVLFHPTSSENIQEVQAYTYNVVKVYPHDAEAFTEGLLYANGFLYESTGLQGSSSLRQVDLTSGQVLQQTALASQYFGEGLALVKGKLIQLTWLNSIGFVYNETSFAVVGNFSYPTEGWGLTYDGMHLIMSDGSDTLHFLDAQTYQQTTQLQVHDGNRAVVNINELEYVNGDIYANIWETEQIAIINPQTGQVEAWVDLSGLHNINVGNNGVLNGIAYDPITSRLFVTGKNWANLYEITLKPKT